MSALVVGFNHFSVMENTRRQRDWWWRIGGGFDPFLRTVVVSIGGGSVVVWRIGGGFDRWWFLSVEDRWWWRWVSPLSFEQRKQEDTAMKAKKKRKKEKKERNKRK